MLPEEQQDVGGLADRQPVRLQEGRRERRVIRAVHRGQQARHAALARGRRRRSRRRLPPAPAGRIRRAPGSSASKKVRTPCDAPQLIRDDSIIHEDFDVRRGNRASLANGNLPDKKSTRDIVITNKNTFKGCLIERGDLDRPAFYFR
jgi:hypothetical protein